MEIFVIFLGGCALAWGVSYWYRSLPIKPKKGKRLKQDVQTEPDQQSQNVTEQETEAAKLQEAETKNE